MANYNMNQNDAGVAPEDIGGAAADDFGFELEKQPTNKGAMVLVLLLVLGGGGLYFLYDQSSFAKANDPIADNSAVTAGTTTTLQAIRTQLDETRRTVAIFERVANRPAIPVGELQTNPFSAVRDTAVVAKAPDGGEPTAAQKRAQLLEQATLDLAKLKLQSTILAGADSTCTITINGSRRQLRLGDTIKADTTEFTVVRVELETVDGKPVTRVILSAHEQEFVLTRR